MSWDKINYMFSKFNFNFTWKYTGDGELRSILPDVFRILDDDDERSLEQILIGFVHQANPGLTLCQPNDDLNTPYEVNFIVHPPHESFCVTKIVLLSEARNLELYINDGYEKSTRGIMITLNKERKSSLFEGQFDLSGYTETKSNAKIKFLSYPCKEHMKLQAIILKVEQCKPISSLQSDQSTGGPVNLSSVRRYLGSVGRPLSNDAQKMLQSIENYQKSPAFKAQQMLSSQAALLQNIRRTKEAEAFKEKQEEKEVCEEEQHANQPEQDKPFMNMLSELGINHQSNSNKKYSTDITASPQARWTAYLQSRVRASKKTSPQSSPILRSMSFDGYSGVNEEMRDKRTRQRPLSVGCVSKGVLDQTFDPEQLRQKYSKEESSNSRCDKCGCPGCISVFNSISTSVFAVEKIILEKVDEKFAKLQEDMNCKFQLLYELIDRKKFVNNEED